MDDQRPPRRAHSFLVGSLLGGLVVLAAPHARRRRRQLTLPRGLAAFEGAPCGEARPDGTVPERSEAQG